MTIYLAVEWAHTDPRENGEPVLFYSELDEGRRETRKIDVWADGSTGWADGAQEVGTRLSELPIPSLAAIEAAGPFRAREIAAEDFELLWESRFGSASAPGPA